MKERRNCIRIKDWQKRRKSINVAIKFNYNLEFDWFIYTTTFNETDFLDCPLTTWQMTTTTKKQSQSCVTYTTFGGKACESQWTWKLFWRETCFSWNRVTYARELVFQSSEFWGWTVGLSLTPIELLWLGKPRSGLTHHPVML